MKSGTESSVTVAPPPTAVYKQIEGELRSRIRTATWPVGAMLPSRRDLARHFGVSTLTVERAISRLTDEGLLRSDDRRGTFVASQGAEAGEMLGNSNSALVAPPIHRAAPHSRSEAVSFTVGIVASLYDLRYAHEYDPLALNDFWVRLLVHSLEQNFAETGESTRFFNRVSPDDHSLLPLTERVDAALAEGMDAVAIIGMGVPREDIHAALDRLQERSVPVVCAWTGKLIRPVPHVFIDDHSAGYQAAEHLIRQGARDLFLFSPFRTGWQAHRWEGVRAAAAHTGLPDEAITIFPPDSPKWETYGDPTLLGYNAACEALSSGLRPANIVASNDGVAFGWMKAASENGLEAGRDYRLIGFDDHPDARLCQLTTMRPAGEAMGQEMSRLLRQSLRGDSDSLQVSLRSRLIPRTSTRRETGPVEKRDSSRKSPYRVL